MILEIVLSTSCMITQGVKPEIIASTDVFEVPLICVRKAPCGRDPNTCRVYSNGAFSFKEDCNWCTCVSWNACSCTAMGCVHAPWWEEK